MIRPRFQVAQALNQNLFFHFDGFQETRQAFRRHRKLSGMIPLPFPQLLADQMNLPFRMAVQTDIVFRMTLNPLSVHKRKAVPTSNGS